MTCPLAHSGDCLVGTWLRVHFAIWHVRLHVLVHELVTCVGTWDHDMYPGAEMTCDMCIYMWGDMCVCILALGLELTRHYDMWGYMCWYMSVLHVFVHGTMTCILVLKWLVLWHLVAMGCGLGLDKSWPCAVTCEATCVGTWVCYMCGYMGPWHVSWWRNDLSCGSSGCSFAIWHVMTHEFLHVIPYDMWCFMWWHMSWLHVIRCWIALSTFQEGCPFALHVKRHVMTTCHGLHVILHVILHVASASRSFR
jgi:hypothetical protein